MPLAPRGGCFFNNYVIQWHKKEARESVLVTRPAYQGSRIAH